LTLETSSRRQPLRDSSTVLLRALSTRQVSFYVQRLWLRCIHRIGRIVSSTIIV
jgi:hypothetical protein